MLSYGTKVSSPVALLTVIGLIVVAIVLMLAPAGRVSGQTTISVSPTTLTSAFDIDGNLNVNVTDGDTIIFDAGDYIGVGTLTINKKVTLIGHTGDYRTSGAVLTGATRLVITSSDVTVKGFNFQNTTADTSGSDALARRYYNRGVINTSGGGLSNITIEKNEFNKTHTHGILVARGAEFTIHGNKFVNIGFNDKLTEIRNKETAIYAERLTDSYITDNTINNTTWSGMNLVIVARLTINNNTIDGTAKNGIQVWGTLDANIIISGNTITNANNNLTRIDTETGRINRGSPPRVEIISGDPVNDPDNAIVRFIDPDIKAAISVDRASGVEISGNTLKNNHDGIIICPGNCGINDPTNPLDADPVYATSAVVRGNVIQNNNAVQTAGTTQGSVDLTPFNLPSGTNLINGSPQVVNAANNYWGSPASPQTSGAFVGTVTYRPWYANEALTKLVVAAPEPNVAPFAVGRIPDQVIVMDGSSHTLDVSGYFRDLDNDFLRYAPQSVDPMVLTATVMGNTVVFNPGGLGTTSMVVTAFDKADATAFQTFTITVVESTVAPDPNVAPEAVGAIEDQMVQVGDEPLELDVADYFTDADGDELTYMAASSDEAIATVTAMGSTISLTGVAAGEATITVTATDPSGESAMQMFMVTVSLPNTAPEAVGFIEDQVMLENGVPMEIDVAEYFTDADGDELEYTAESANAEVVTSVLIDGVTVMVLSPFAPGEGVEVTVTATDPVGESATQSFMVTVLEAMMPVEPTATPEPTPEPTMAPTPEPTVAPTVEPTVAPTVAPELDDGGGFPAWAIVLILLIVVGVGAGVFVMQRNRS